MERYTLHISALPMNRTADTVVPKETVQSTVSQKIKGVQEIQKIQSTAPLTKTLEKSHLKDLATALNLKKTL